VRATRNSEGEQRAESDCNSASDLHDYLLTQAASHPLAATLAPSGGQRKLSGDPRMGDNWEIPLRRLT